nr:MAG TPA: Single strand binding protein [Caudoviricetes sp.]
MNKLIIIGNLTKDPELSETPSGISYAKFTVAVSRNYTNSDGEKETDFFDITAWRERAELCAKYLRKGNKVGIVGSVQFRTYEDEKGNKRKITEVKVDEIEFLTPKSSEGDKPRNKEKPRLEETDEELPF